MTKSIFRKYLKVNRQFMLLIVATLNGLGCSPVKNESRNSMEPRISVITLGVEDLEKSYQFYKKGLGLPTQMTPEGGIIIFSTTGTVLSLYAYEKLAEDAGIQLSKDHQKTTFPGFTLAHAVRNKDDVDTLLLQAEEAGGRIVKKAKDTFWGGYGGYFADPDGYLWEINYSEAFNFNPDGTLKID